MKTNVLLEHIRLFVIPMFIFLNGITISQSPHIHHIFSYGLILITGILFFRDILYDRTFIKKIEKINRIFKTFFLLVIWAGLSTLFSQYSAEAVDSFMRLFFFFIFLVFLSSQIKSHAHFLYGLYALLMVGLVLALSIYIQFISKFQFYTDTGVVRYFGVIDSPNIGGYILGFTTLLTLILPNVKLRLFLFIFMSGALFLTYSRSSWLMVFVGVSFYLYHFYRTNIFNKYSLSVMAIGLVLLVLFWDKAYILLRLGDGLITHRNYLWAAAIRITGDNLLFGIGPGMLFKEMGVYIEGVTEGTEVWNVISFGFSHAHSMFLTICAELGIPAMLISLFLCLSIIKMVWKPSIKNMDYVFVLKAILIGYFVRSFFESGGLLASGWMGFDIYIWYLLIAFPWYNKTEKISKTLA